MNELRRDRHLRRFARRNMVDLKCRSLKIAQVMVPGDAGRITARVGSILPLSEARQAQAMLAGAPHKSGKIVLQIGHA